MARPLIGVTGTARRWSPSWWCIRTALYLSGARAHRISVLAPDIPDNIAGFVISGGDDIHPDLYSETPSQAEGEFDPERDQLEIACINHAFVHSKPLLGICRGAQLINVVMDGTLHQDVNPLRKRTSTRSHLSPRKTVKLTPGSLLASVVGRERLKVNSLHKQAVDKPGNRLSCVGYDLDNIVQAFEAARDIIGVQWHPEYLFFFPAQLAIFRWLARRARRN